jgi:LmbE family N-acetylglucosaminyl deacetylase
VAKDSVTCCVLSPGARSLSAGRGQVSQVETFVAPERDRSRPDCIEVDVRPFAMQKLRALACHRSQYALDAEVFPRVMVEKLFGSEYFVEQPLG